MSDPLETTLLVSQTISDHMRTKKSTYSLELANAIEALPPDKQMILENKLNEVYGELKEKEREECLKKWKEKDHGYLVHFWVEAHTINRRNDICDAWFVSIEEMAHYVYQWLDSHSELCMRLEEKGLQFKRATKDSVSISKHQFIQYWEDIYATNKNDHFEFDCDECGDIYAILMDIHTISKELRIMPNTRAYE